MLPSFPNLINPELPEKLKGLYIHPDIWHEAISSLKGKQNFLTKQGAVHARVSLDVAKEFNCLIEVSFS